MGIPHNERLSTPESWPWQSALHHDSCVTFESQKNPTLLAFCTWVDNDMMQCTADLVSLSIYYHRIAVQWMDCNHLDTWIYTYIIIVHRSLLACSTCRSWNTFIILFSYTTSAKRNLVVRSCCISSRPGPLMPAARSRYVSVSIKF
jgi:hypothetical protein